MCFASVESVYNPETKLMEPEYSYGCLPGDERGTMQCRGQSGKSVQCCNYMDLCNNLLKPEIDTRPSTPSPGMTYDESIHYIALIISLTVCFVALLVIVAYYYLRYKKREDMRLLSLSRASRYVLKHYSYFDAIMNRNYMLIYLNVSGIATHI